MVAHTVLAPPTKGICLWPFSTSSCPSAPHHLPLREKRFDTKWDCAHFFFATPPASACGWWIRNGITILAYVLHCLHTGERFVRHGCQSFETDSWI